MRQIRILEVSFDTEIQPYQLTQFRGAIAQKAGLQHELFHNHDNENGGFHNRYPLIQYKLDTHKGQMRPMLLCLEEGIEEAHHFFSQPDWSINLHGTQHPLRVARLHVNRYTLNVWQRQFSYRLHKWQPFNGDNYDKYKLLRGIAEKFQFLETLLRTQIQSFAKGVGWEIEEPIDLHITDLVKQEWLEFKSKKVLSFTLDFQTNVSLPDYIGVGKGASKGLGVVRRVRERISMTDKN
jgi:Cas6b C-terminal domain/Cas6b N-terminal domain